MEAPSNPLDSLQCQWRLPPTLRPLAPSGLGCLLSFTNRLHIALPYSQQRYKAQHEGGSVPAAGLRRRRGGGSRQRRLEEARLLWAARLPSLPAGGPMCQGWLL